MSDKKKPRQSGTRKPKKSIPLANRRRFASVGAKLAAQCSMERPENSPSSTGKQGSTKGSSGLQITPTRKDNKIETYPERPTVMQKACRLWFEKISKLGLRGIRKEFFSHIRNHKVDIVKDTDLISAFCDPANIEKNRYDDVYLLDKTRVKVTINPDSDDYIHASFVEVSSELTYICAQGPLENTITQFWLMCVQEDVKVILQLCKFVEDGKEKCCNYLPSDSDTASFGCVEVKIIKPSTTVSGTDKVYKSTVQCKFGEKVITVTHLLYAGWPDHTVAESVSTCREVRNLVQKLCEKKPIVVHCSAGIGRTGSFVAIEMICHKLLKESKGDFSTVELMRDLRNKRALAIQNDQQYTFVFRCMLDILLAEGGLTKTAESGTFIENYENLLERKKQTARIKASKRKIAAGN